MAPPSVLAASVSLVSAEKARNVSSIFSSGYFSRMVSFHALLKYHVENCLYAFLDYTEPDNLRNNIKEGLMVCRRTQDKEKEFEKRCIQRWAISELAKAIVEDPDNPVEDVAYRFALKLYGYACTSFDAKMRNVFGVAAEFIDKEVIGLFRTEDGVYP